MKKARVAAAAGVAGALLTIPALTYSASATSTSSAPPESLLSVCLTVTPKSIAVSINGITIGNGSAGLPRTCLVI